MFLKITTPTHPHLCRMRIVAVQCLDLTQGRARYWQEGSCQRSNITKGASSKTFESSWRFWKWKNQVFKTTVGKYLREWVCNRKPNRNIWTNLKHTCTLLPGVHWFLLRHWSYVVKYLTVYNNLVIFYATFSCLYKLNRSQTILVFIHLTWRSKRSVRILFDRISLCPP